MTNLAPEPQVRTSAAATESLALAQTARSLPPEDPTYDSLVSGATLRGSEPSAPAAIPDRIGRFMVIGPLGSGGMGIVVQAYDPELDRKVAIKLLKSSRARPDSQARLLREAQAMARLSHANVVQVYDVGVVGDQVFVAMELVVGKTLAEWLSCEQRDWRAIVAVFTAAARGLQAAHAVGLVHRDFKPDNVLIADDGQVRVADFGLARGDPSTVAAKQPNQDTTGDRSDERLLLANTLTATGVLMGTPMYMSPEQFRAETVGPQSDIFSFAVALYEGLYGLRPFAGETMSELARNVLNGITVAPPSDRRVPSWLDTVVRRGFAVDTDLRYPSFAEFLVALARDPSRRRKRWLGATTLALSAALIGGGLQARATGESCTASALASAEIWNDDVRTQIREHLQYLPQETRSSIEPALLRGLGDYADEWATQGRAACTGNREGDRSDTLFDAQVRCLDRRRAALSHAIETILSGDAATLQNATMIVAKLPPVAYCADQEALLAEVLPPEDVQVKADVEMLRKRLLQAEVLASAGHPQAGLDAAMRLRDAIEATHYRPLFAEASLAEGRMRVDAREPKLALEAFETAFIVATETGADALAAEAKARTIFVRGVTLNDPQVLGERAHAEALHTRVGRPDLAALVANNSGAVLAASGQKASARKLFRQAIELSRGDPLTRPIDFAGGYLKNLALVTDDPVERDQLFAEIAATFDRTLSPTHPVALDLSLTRAMQSADPREAAEHFAHTCPLIASHNEGALYMRCAECYHRLAHTQDDLGQSDLAATTMAQALTCLNRHVLQEDQEVVSSWRALLSGHQHLYSGDTIAAAVDLAEARRIMEPHRAQWWIALLLADIDLADGRRLAADNPGAAIPHLEAAIAGFEPLRERAFDRLPSYGLARAQTLLAAALLVDRGDTYEDSSNPTATVSEAAQKSVQKRAKELIDAAEDYYRDAGPGYAERLSALSTFRATHLSADDLER